MSPTRNLQLLRRETDQQLAAPALHISESPAQKPRTAGANSEVTPEFLLEATKLVHRLFVTPGQPAPGSVMFCGIDRGAGCTTVCCRAAEILAAQVQGKVCLVDANLRAPSLHRQFGIENRAGFSDALGESGPLSGLAQQVGEGNLWVVTCGAALETSLPARSERLRSQMLELRGAFDYVLVDTAPVKLSLDAILLGQVTEGAVLVIQSNSTRRETARQAKEILEAANVRILGAVLNQWASPVPEFILSRPSSK